MSQGVTEENLSSFLHSLGHTSMEIAETLGRQGIKGIRGSCGGCPIAIAINKHFDSEYGMFVIADVTPAACWIYVDTVPYTVKTPYVVAAFIEQFDAGIFRGLESRTKSIWE